MPRPVYRRIFVVVDGSPASEQALPLAEEIARRSACQLELLAVATPPTTGSELYGRLPTDELLANVHEPLQERVRQLAAQVQGSGLAATSAVLDGTATHALAEYLDQAEAELVIMTTHDRARLERLLLGSAADDVVRWAHVPVLLVHAIGGDAAVPQQVEQILVPLDGSQFSEQVLPHAAKLAAVFGARVLLLGVVEPLPPVVALAGPPAISLPAAQWQQDQTEAALREALETAAERLAADGVAADTEIMTADDVAKAIIDCFDGGPLSMAAMTTHGRGALKRLVAGSVSDRVLRSTRKPLLLYRPKLQ